MTSYRPFLPFLLLAGLIAGCDSGATDVSAKTADAGTDSLPFVETYDFGVIRSDAMAQEIEASVLLRNESAAPVTITEAVATCACTRAEVDTGVILPGETRELHARIDVGKLGKLNEAVFLMHDNVLVGRITLRGEIVPGQSIWSDHHTLRLALNGSKGNIILSALVDGHTVPQEPTVVRAPNGVRVHFLPWTLVYGPGDQSPALSRWQAIAVVDAANPAPSSGPIEISVHELAQSARVMLDFDLR